MVNQANAQKILLRHKENLEPNLQQCTLCDQEFDKNDSLYDIRVSRHIQGMHSKDRTIFSERTGSPSKPMGNHTYGDAKFVPVSEKRKDESIDVQYCSGKHKCEICNKTFKCEGENTSHSGGTGSGKCHGGYNQFCDNHTLAEYTKKHKELGEL